MAQSYIPVASDIPLSVGVAVSVFFVVLVIVLLFLNKN